MCSRREKPVKTTKEASHPETSFRWGLKKNVQANSKNWLKSLSTLSRQFDQKASAWCFSQILVIIIYMKSQLFSHYVANGVWLLLNI